MLAVILVSDLFDANILKKSSKKTKTKKTKQKKQQKQQPPTKTKLKKQSKSETRMIFQALDRKTDK